MALDIPLRRTISGSELSSADSLGTRRERPEYKIGPAAKAVLK
jgi:hypothetical protein